MKCSRRVVHHWLPMFLITLARDFESKVYNFFSFSAQGIEDRHAGTPLATVGIKNILRFLEEHA
jgi:hypothetical protein